MGFRFRKSVKIIPGVRLNFSKSGISTSIGGPGATVNLSNRGTRHTLGIPGSGLSYSTFASRNSEGSGNTPTAGSTSNNLASGCGCFSLIIAALVVVGQCSQPDGATAPSQASDKASTNPTTPADTKEEPSGAALFYDPGDTVYITASALNGRAAPSSNGPILTKLSRGSSARVIDRSGKWLKVAAGATAVWIASSHVSSSRPSAPQPLYSSTRSKSGNRSSGSYYGGSCPCSGSRVCIGPRGGRYCITSGGNKRYGV